MMNIRRLRSRTQISDAIQDYTKQEVAPAERTRKAAAKAPKKLKTPHEQQRHFPSLDRLRDNRRAASA